MHRGRAVDRYVPDTSPGADEWLQLDEVERLEMVKVYHRRTLRRLEERGTESARRHPRDRLCPFGALVRVDASGSGKKDEAYADYFERLGKLPAASWLAG